MASRLLYGLARQGVLPHVLGSVHPTRRTPWVSILFTTALAFGLIYFVVTNSQAQAITCSAAQPRCCCSASSPSSTSP